MNTKIGVFNNRTFSNTKNAAGKPAAFLLN